MLRKQLLVILLALVAVGSVMAQGKHEMKNMRVSFEATDYRNSRSIEKVTSGSKNYIKGIDSKYKDKETSRLLQPFVDYNFIAKSLGGEFEVTVTYKIDKKIAGNSVKLTLGVDELPVQELELKNSALTNRARATFDVKLLRGKTHLLKVWLPTKGVLIEKFEIRRKVFGSTKDDSQDED